jgi:hypothetical protein
MAGRPVQASPATRPGEDLVQTFTGQRLPAARALQHHEHPISARGNRTLVMQIVAQRIKEPIHHRHHTRW